MPRSPASALVLAAILFTQLLSIPAFLQTPQANAHSQGISLSGLTSTAPTLDGVIGTEWQNAGVMDFVTLGGKFSGTIYVMNDQSTLYVGLRIMQSQIEDNEFVFVYFDQNHNGVVENDEDAILYTPLSTHYDWYVTDPGSLDGFSGVGFDADIGHSVDVSAGATNDGTNTYIELSHPLCSGDTLDFCLSPNDIVGFDLQIGYEIIGPPFEVVSDSWPAAITESPSAGNWGDIKIASDGTPLKPDFNISITPASKTVGLTGSTSFDIEVTALNGFTSSVELSVNFLPSRLSIG